MRLLEVGDVAGCVSAPPANVGAAWPALVEALQWRGIDGPEVRVGMAATIAIECPPFKPIRERYAKGQTPEQYFARYAPPHPVAAKLGNRDLADALAYIGRGFLQITGRTNYVAYGKAIGIDLEKSPDLALDPHHSARIAAAYFRDRGVDKACQVGDWRSVRRLVNGGYNGWEEFKGKVDQLMKVAA